MATIRYSDFHEFGAIPYEYGRSVRQVQWLIAVA